jgi:membrane fusion protein (multidrug efflux system)
LASRNTWLAWRRRFPTEASRLAADKNLHLQLILADGSTYPHESTFFFADCQVNESTGGFASRDFSPIPKMFCVPGGYGKVRAVIRTQQAALVIPQRAVSEIQGGYQVAVVDADDKTAIRNLKVADRVDNLCVVTEGLNPGERVVVEGLQKARAGAHVNPPPSQPTPKESSLCQVLSSTAQSSPSSFPLSVACWFSHHSDLARGAVS